MESLVLVVLLVVVLICWMVLSNRISDLRQRMEEQDARRADARLIARIYALEKEVAELRLERTISVAENIAAEALTAKTVVSAAPVVVPQSPESAIAELARAPVDEEAEPAAPEPAGRPLTPEAPLPEIPVREPTFATTSTVRLSERLREKMPNEEWEAIVGGNWLNKVGVFVLVIGIALFPGYSFTRMGPPRRVTIEPLSR